MNVQWTKNIPTFTALPLPDQLLLLEESWRELFVLSAAQVLPIGDIASLTPTTQIDSSAFHGKVQQFQEVLTSLRHFQLDQCEYVFLRAICLFKTRVVDEARISSTTSDDASNETLALVELARVAAIQEETQLTLNKYMRNVYPEQPLRFAKLMLMVPSLRSVSSEVIEELFFRKTIGNIPIVRIICDMYKSQ